MSENLSAKLSAWAGRMFLGILARSFAALPDRGRRAWARSLGGCLRRLGYRRRVVRRNLALALPDATEAERAQLECEAYESLGFLTFEILQYLGDFRGYAERHTEIRGLENWRAAKAHGRGVVFLSSHLGNWELMAAAGGMAGIDLLLITKLLKPRWLHDAIERGRARCGVGGTYEPRTFRDALTHLRKGETVGIILDQFAGAPIGVRVPFFGVAVGTSSGLAAIVRRTRAAIVPVYNSRDPRTGKIIVEIEPEIEWIDHAGGGPHELAVNTAAFVRVLEGHIRRHPGQWLWVHNRFKGNLEPLGPEEWKTGRARH